MKILFVVPYAPNLVRVRPYNFIRSLTGRGHRVTVLTLWANEGELADLEALRPFCEKIRAVHISKLRSLLNCALAVPSRRPFQSVYSWQPELVQGAEDWAEYDVVHVEHLRGSPYALYFKRNSPLPVVWDSVDCITHLFRQAVAQSQDLVRRWRSQLDLKRTERYEGWLAYQFDHVLVTSSLDRRELAALNPNGKRIPISVVPNGVDLDYFSPDTAVNRAPATLVVSGKMSYHANIAMTLHLVQDIMPYIWQRRADVQLQIVGKDPTREIMALGQHPAVTVTGTVPDLPPYLQQATVAVAPITYSAGIQNKILEAMACATPVVTTPRAVNALGMVPGHDLLVADHPQAIARQILELINDPARQQRIGQAGYQYVRNHHTWSGAAAQLERIYGELIADRAGQISR